MAPRNDFNKALGHESKPLPVNWNQRDLLLYATGIGAKANELSALYEESASWKAPATYPLVLGLKLDATSISNFAKAKDAGGDVPGLPNIPPEKGVHAEQSITILKQIPNDSGEGWTIRKKCVGIKDTGKGLIVDGEINLVSPEGEVYVRMISSGYGFGKYTNKEDGSAGFAKSIAPPQPAKGLSKPPTSAPTHVFTEKTSSEQAILYRLSGDYNPLHIDPSIGKALGFGGVILHGLCSYGHAARAILLSVADGDGSRLEYMSSRFTSPVIPGDELETTMWVSEDAKTGGKRVDFVQKIKGSGKVCLGGGVALIKKAGAAKSKL
ncbi:HotDog domain-containing protein [Leucosporidium creatinivorum]|uniref:HotDog domain-containing protein n=1 Tax=Leucosporidium creatinivorum TaxID=106004 RepID=A0A1Y2ET38_9BASI|nr:HotDog domain-containing protein [Leucosporidium creatinivorum]